MLGTLTTIVTKIAATATLATTCPNLGGMLKDLNYDLKSVANTFACSGTIPETDLDGQPGEPINVEFCLATANKIPSKHDKGGFRFLVWPENSDTSDRFNYYGSLAEQDLGLDPNFQSRQWRTITRTDKFIIAEGFNVKAAPFYQGRHEEIVMDLSSGTLHFDFNKRNSPADAWTSIYHAQISCQPITLLN